MYVLIAVVGIGTIALGVNLLQNKKHLFKSAVTTSPVIRKASAFMIIMIGVEWLYGVALVASIDTDEELVVHLGIANMLDGITFELATFVWLFSLLQPQSLRPYVWLFGAPILLPVIMLVCYVIDPKEIYYEVYDIWGTVYVIVLSVMFVFSVRKYNRMLSEHYVDHKNKTLKPLYYALVVYFISIVVNSIAFDGHTTERSVPLTLLNIVCILLLVLFIIWIAETQQMIVRINGMPVSYVPNMLQRDSEGLCLAERIETKLKDESVMKPLMYKEDFSLEDVAQAIGYEPAYLLCYLDLKKTNFNKYFNAKK